MTALGASSDITKPTIINAKKKNSAQLLKKNSLISSTNPHFALEKYVVQQPDKQADKERGQYRKPDAYVQAEEYRDRDQPCRRKYVEKPAAEYYPAAVQRRYWYYAVERIRYVEHHCFLYKPRGDSRTHGLEIYGKKHPRYRPGSRHYGKRPPV